MAKILLVEDDPDIADYVAAEMVDLGHELSVVDAAPDVVPHAEKVQPELILLDRHLPHKDQGLDVARQLRAHSTTKSTPIILLTADVMSSRQEALAAGCNDVETKPLDVDRLAEKIERLLGMTAT